VVVCIDRTSAPAASCRKKKKKVGARKEEGGRTFGFVRPPEKKESFGEIFADFFLRELQTSWQFLSKRP
jgi:hypothetical protein